jgi:hypothetical protein
MALSLNMDVDRRDDGSLHISWNDAVRGVFPKREVTIFVSFLGTFILASIFAREVSDGLRTMGRDAPEIIFGLFIIGGTIISGLWMLSAMFGSRPRPNSVTISDHTFLHNGITYPTANITRIEYGKKAALTGSQSDNEHGSLIRIWIDDNSAHIISDNNWQDQINHQIRDTLARALDSVRKDKAKANKAEKYGDQGDLGMPDY